MEKTFSVFEHVRRFNELKYDILARIKKEEDSELIYGSAVLKFDSKRKVISFFPVTDKSCTNKIIPIEISYGAFFRLMESDEPWLIAEKECRRI